ncbi:MAG: hypothetical protein A3G25_06570 [Betaproteobacteria bacterium RIFCSPLOWO2_12_FULL_63_13]|nr:MAG: hypothetical protein A3G25_06570 [Betaproteobacteria bacterium RIFCSPLOWO2_12_FULL_63_13]
MTIAFGTKLLFLPALFAFSTSPTSAQTASYDASTRYLTLPSVQVLDTEYKDVIVRLDSIVVLDLGSPVPAQAGLTSPARYDPSQRTLTLPGVTAAGVSYYGLVARIDSFVLISLGDSSPAAPAIPPDIPYYGY